MVYCNLGFIDTVLVIIVGLCSAGLLAVILSAGKLLRRRPETEQSEESHE